MEISCQAEPVETRTVITSPAPLEFSLFCTSIPPGRTSHSISPVCVPVPVPYSPQAPLDPAFCLELLLNNFFDFNLIIFISLTVLLSLSQFSLSFNWWLEALSSFIYRRRVGTRFRSVHLFKELVM